MVEQPGNRVPDIRVGRIVEAAEFPEARKPSYRLTIDFGPLGSKRSVAQLVSNYSAAELIGKQVIAVVDLSPRQIGPAISEVLTLGVPDQNGQCVLVEPDRDVPLGGSLY